LAGFWVGGGGVPWAEWSNIGAQGQYLGKLENTRKLFEELITDRKDKQKTLRKTRGGEGGAVLILGQEEQGYYAKAGLTRGALTASLKNYHL